MEQAVDRTSSSIHYRTDRGLKERLFETAEAQGRSVNDLLDELVTGYLNQSGSNGIKADPLRLQAECSRCWQKLKTVADDKDKEALRDGLILQKLVQAYGTMGNDFIRLRIQAINDYRRNPQEFREKLGIRGELRIYDACERGRQIVELKIRIRDLELKLAEIKGVAIEPLPIYAVKPLPEETDIEKASSENELDS